MYEPTTNKPTAYNDTLYNTHWDESMTLNPYRYHNNWN